jgi:DTW domain-containing protein YfiP
MNDYQETVQKKYKNKTSEQLTARLKANSKQLILMKDPEVVALFNTEQNIKKILAETLLILTTIAEREGYTIKELMH